MDSRDWSIGSEEPEVLENLRFSPTQQDALFAFDFTCIALLQLQD